MAITRFSVDVQGAQLPSDYKQRKLATLFSSTPGENVQPFPFWFTDVIPTARGFKSIQYDAGEQLPVIVGDQNHRPAYKILPTADVEVVPILAANDLIYIRNTSTLLWGDSGIPANPTPFQPTIAVIQAQSFVYKPSVGIYKLDSQSGTLTAFPLDWGGITPPSFDTIRGICSNSGYLMLYTVDTIYWSSPIDPADFRLVDAGQIPTGAGSTRIQSLLGTIQYSTRIAGGSIIYSNKNIVSVRYTGSSSNPWAFVEIPNAGGVTRAYHVSTPDDGNTHYVWSTKGLITVSLGQARRILKEFTDFISTNQYRLLTDTEIEDLDTPTDIALHNILGGKLCFSVGAEDMEFSVLWLYDLDLNRWGRMEHEHWAVAPHHDVSLTDRPTYDRLLLDTLTFDGLANVTMRSMLGQAEDIAAKPDRMTLLGSDSMMQVVNLLADTTTAVSKVFIGDIRLSRSRACTVQRVLLQTTESKPLVTLRPVYQPLVNFIESTYEPSNYLGYGTANYHVLELSGNFTISAIEVSLQDAGYAL